MTVSKKNSVDQSQFLEADSQSSSLNSSESEVLQPLIDLLLNLEGFQADASTSSEPEVAADDPDPQEKPDQKIESFSDSSTASQSASAVKSDQDVSDQADQNHTPKPSSRSPEESPEKDELTQPLPLKETPSSAVDVSYSVTAIKTGDTWIKQGSEAEENPEEETTISSAAEQSSDDPLEQLQNLIFGEAQSDLEQLKRQLLESELPEIYHRINQVDSHVNTLEKNIYNSQQLIVLIQPLIAEILRLKISDSKQDLIQALFPIIDELIEAKTTDNKEQMSRAIANLIPEAIHYQMVNYPEEIAHAIAPEMGEAIREQIRLDSNKISEALAPAMGKAIKEQVILERDAMIDALYPVIGSTITRYMGEAIREINEKISNTLSLEGVQRKIRAKVQGVSEAELILQEVMKFTVKAVFLIHKASGLIISEVQESGEEKLESEMLAGMLTAIRSFVNDCVIKAEEVQELNEIEYGDSRIIIEVAGYCYLAVVVKGEINHRFLQKIRATLTTIIQRYGKNIEEFDGDSETIPTAVEEQLKILILQNSKSRKNQPPIALLLVSIVVLSLILIPWGIYQYRRGVNSKVETAVDQSFDSEPELALYRLNSAADRNTLTLTGKLPNQRLKEKAEVIAQKNAPNWEINNEIVAVKVPPDPLLVEAEVKRLTAVLNQMNGISISTQYQSPDQVKIEGTVIQPEDVDKITQAFENIEGVQSITSGLTFKPLPITTRIYFQSNSAKILPQDLTIKVLPIAQYMKQFPDLRLRITGYTDQVGKPKENQQLALKRAQAVQTALESYGVDRSRIEATGKAERPPGVTEDQPTWLSRTVIFEIISPNK